MNDKIDPVLAMIANYKQAILNKDIEAFCAIYDTDIHIFDMWGKWSMRGIDAWREMASGWFTSLGSEKVVVEANNVESVVTADMAIGHAILSYTAFSAKGEKLRSLDNRITVALKRTGDSWKVVHEHTSAPIDHGSLKGNLQFSNE
ncbi:MAG: nuclear transport factor 2 family protein [Cellvibrio sp.]|uniref:YybH family protein n=1 Tax=Cellvibrio sp. TaxID=1965322 RepID=UPI0031B38AA0